MRRSLAVVVLAGVASLFSVSPAYAGAHFIGSQTSASQDGANVVCSFKEAGLSAGSEEQITCNADAETTYECVNNGGRNPSASNKTTTKSKLSKSGKFKADKSGNVTGSVTLSPPSASELGFSCPKGQTTTFVSITYSNVEIVDQTSGASQDLGGPFTYTNPNAP